MMTVATALLAALSLTANDESVLSLEERLLATVPEDLALEGEPITGPDGKSYPVVQRVTWSPDGTQVAYVGLREGARVPVVGETPLGSYHYADRPLFGATGENVVFRVGNRKKNNKSEEWWLLTGDGTEHFEQDWLGAPAFSPDGTRLAVWAQPGAKIAADGSYTGGHMAFATAQLTKGKWKFKKGKKHDDANALIPARYSADGKIVGTLAADGDDWVLLFNNGKREKPATKEDFNSITDFAVSPNGKDFALVVMAESYGDFDMPTDLGSFSFPGMKSEIVHGDDRFGKDYDNVGAPSFSPDGKTLAYKIQRDGKCGVALGKDKRANARWDFVLTPVFSPDSRNFAYIAIAECELSAFFGLSAVAEANVKGGEWQLVVEHGLNRKKIETSPETYSEIRDVVWSPDGERIAYRAKTEDGWIIVCGELKSEAYDEVGAPRFAPDSSGLAFGARTERELWWKVLKFE